MPSMASIHLNGGYVDELPAAPRWPEGAERSVEISLGLVDPRERTYVHSRARLQRVQLGMRKGPQRVEYHCRSPLRLMVIHQLRDAHAHSQGRFAVARTAEAGSAYPIIRSSCRWPTQSAWCFSAVGPHSHFNAGVSVAAAATSNARSCSRSQLIRCRHGWRIGVWRALRFAHPRVGSCVRSYAASRARPVLPRAGR